MCVYMHIFYMYTVPQLFMMNDNIAMHTRIIKAVSILKDVSHSHRAAAICFTDMEKAEC